MADTHSYEIVGRRIWMSLPYGSPVKDRIKAAGAHWDSGSKRWWIGTVARDIVVPILDEAMGIDSAELVTVEVDLDAAKAADAITRTGGRPSARYVHMVSTFCSLSVGGARRAGCRGDRHLHRRITRGSRIRFSHVERVQESQVLTNRVSRSQAAERVRTRGG